MEVERKIYLRQNGMGMGWSIVTVRVERLHEGCDLAKKPLIRASGRHETQSYGGPPKLQMETARRAIPQKQPPSL